MCIDVCALMLYTSRARAVHASMTTAARAVEPRCKQQSACSRLEIESCIRDNGINITIIRMTSIYMDANNVTAVEYN